MTIYDPDDIPHRTGPSKRQMEEDLRRAVLNTGGTLVKGVALPASNKAVALKPAPAPARKPAAAAVEPAAAPASATTSDTRWVEPIKFEGLRKPILSAAPKLRMADPTVLRVEAKYQRDISRKSLKLIEKIVANWDWAKFKPPICAQTEQGLWIIDGQHTAIAAATHPEIKEIPILIVNAAEIARRAAAFVSHNTDRVVMTPAQVFHGQVAAGVNDAPAILDAVIRGGGKVPRGTVGRRDSKPGYVTGIEELRVIYRAHGSATLERIIRIAVLSKITPVGMLVLRAVRDVIAGEHASRCASMSDTKIAGALASIDNFVVAAQARASGTGKGRGWGGGQLLAERLRAPR